MLKTIGNVIIIALFIIGIVFLFFFLPDAFSRNNDEEIDKEIKKKKKEVDEIQTEVDKIEEEKKQAVEQAEKIREAIDVIEKKREEVKDKKYFSSDEEAIDFLKEFANT